jgi:D-citramalate synthase
METLLEKSERIQFTQAGSGVTHQRHIEIMDTTLRDGEQTSGVSFSASEKLTIAQLLLTEVKVDRIEVASARVSEGEFDAVKKLQRGLKQMVTSIG